MIRKATPADLPRLCRTGMRAFADDPVMRWFYPDDAEYEAGGGAVFRWPMLRWLQWDETWMTDDGAALAAWIPPGRPEVVVPEPPPTDHPEDRLARFAAIGEVMEANTPPEPHWYLNLLATHPDWQRHGLGAQLIEQVGSRAAQEGLPLYLETETIENVAYYSRLGFVVRTEWDVPLDGPHMWGMLRPAW
ncbi:MAG: GNAT family N-acetyltransferase [Acidimicrobiia bacterium]